MVFAWPPIRTILIFGAGAQTLLATGFALPPLVAMDYSLIANPFDPILKNLYVTPPPASITSSETPQLVDVS